MWSFVTFAIFHKVEEVAAGAEEVAVVEVCVCNIICYVIFWISNGIFTIFRRRWCKRR